MCYSISRPSAFMPSTIMIDRVFKSQVLSNGLNPSWTRLFFISCKKFFFHFWWFVKVECAELWRIIKNGKKKKNLIQVCWNHFYALIPGRKHPIYHFRDPVRHYSTTNLWKPSSAASQKLFLVKRKFKKLHKTCWNEWSTKRLFWQQKYVMLKMYFYFVVHVGYMYVGPGHTCKTRITVSTTM